MFSRIKRWLSFLLRAKLRGFVESIIEEKFDELLEINLQLRDYARASEQEKASYWENQFDAHQLSHRFENLGISVEKIEINFQDFEDWMNLSPVLVKFYEKSGDVKIEKILD